MTWCSPVSWCCWVKRMCAANTSWSLRASATWKGDPSPGLFPNMKILVGKPWWCNTEAGNATLNSCDFELIFPPVPGDSANLQSKWQYFPSWGRISYPSLLVRGWWLGYSETSTPGRAWKSYGGLIWASALHLQFTNKLQVNCACSWVYRSEK